MSILSIFVRAFRRRAIRVHRLKWERHILANRIALMEDQIRIKDEIIESLRAAMKAHDADNCARFAQSTFSAEQYRDRTPQR